jgi:hypothetical protein
MKQFTCSFLRSAANAVLGFEAADEVELLRLFEEGAVCSDGLLGFLLTAGCFGGAGGFRVGSWILDESDAPVNGMR